MRLIMLLLLALVALPATAVEPDSSVEVSQMICAEVWSCEAELGCDSLEDWTVSEPICTPVEEAFGWWCRPDYWALESCHYHCDLQHQGHAHCFNWYYKACVDACYALYGCGRENSPCA